MIKGMFCCFKPKYYTSGVSLNPKPSPECNIENISVCVTDRNTIYDPNEWLNTVDKNINVKDALSFVPPIEKGLVVKVYDGDTITIVSKLPYPDSPLYKFSVRLNGIDCPEIKGKDKSEKECAQLAKQEMTDLVLNKVVTLKNIDTEKYGRILADVYIDDLHINKHMIDKRLAVIYDGGTKFYPKNWMEYYSKGKM
jgi:endonuclease YncB( thermonuclease family)